MTDLTQRVLSALGTRLGPGAILTGDMIGARYSDDHAAPAGAPPVMVLRPADTEGVAAVLSACAALGQPVVVQGGRTGLAGGARVLPGEAVLSLERMTTLQPVDRTAATIVADAGAPLQAVQEAAAAAGLFFGVDIGARGTATVGGNIATNAGGIRVLRYGNFRAQVLGVEAVLADGTVLSSLRGLAKDNSGYDLGQIFIGSEGTLGVVTRACLRLHPAPLGQTVALCALPSRDAAFALLRHMRRRLGGLLSAFEVIFAPLFAEMTRVLDLPKPVSPDMPVHALVEIQGMNPGPDGEMFLAALEDALEEGLVGDVVLSQSEREFDSLWSLRDDCNRYLIALGGDSVGLDVSLPLHRMRDFLDAAAELLAETDPVARGFVFGHLGDGNLHYIVHTARAAEVTRAILGCTAAHGGVITAEHGIGLDKAHYLHLSRSPAQIAVMRRLKAAFDPGNILNPGRVLEAVPAALQKVAG